jgi:hypothetical protein
MRTRLGCLASIAAYLTMGAIAAAILCRVTPCTRCVEAGGFCPEHSE